jgi:type III secretory pathway component EscR
MAVIENVTLAYIAMSIGVINVCLMMGLLNSYLKTYKEIKSGFTIGLIYFTSLILIQNIFTTLYLAIQVIVPAPELLISEIHEPIKPLLFINMIQLVALIVLYRITRK